jgi:hypothetical protein
MITEIVLFDLPEGITREEVAARFRENAAVWRADPDLIRKNYLYDPVRRRGGGAYLWPSVEAARRAHDATWRERVRRLFGSEPVIEYFETPVLVDNLRGETVLADPVGAAP